VTQTFAASILENDEIGGGMHALRLSVPRSVATQTRGGQYFQIRTADDGASDPLLRRPYSPLRVDAAASEITLLVRRVGRGSDWLARRREGDTLDLFGPLGTPFALGGTQRHLLAVASGAHVAALVPLLDEATAAGAEVVLLAGAESAEQHLPLHYLPEAVEVNRATADGAIGAIVATIALAPPYLDWADAVFAAGPDALFVALQEVLRSHRGVRTPTAQVQVWRPIPCGYGACRGCIVETRRGQSLACTDGPVFALNDLVLSLQ